MAKPKPYAKFYSSKEWQRARRWVLQAAAARAPDGIPRCEIEPGCREVADSVDHIVSMSRGGSALDPSNLRPANRRCNSRRVMADLVRENKQLRDGTLARGESNQRDAPRLPPRRGPWDPARGLPKPEREW
jgi:HNH endonuclease.